MSNSNRIMKSDLSLPFFHFKDAYNLILGVLYIPALIFTGLWIMQLWNKDLLCCIMGIICGGGAVLLDLIFTAILVHNKNTGRGLFIRAFFLPIIPLLFGIPIIWFINYEAAPLSLSLICVCLYYFIAAAEKMYTSIDDFEIHALRLRKLLSNRAVNMAIRAISFSLWGLIAAQVVHGLYIVNAAGIKSVWTTFFCFVFPQSQGILTGGIFSVNNMITFFTGSLIIIGWSRKCPCEEWNPYSARQLGLALHIFPFAIVFFGASIYIFAYAFYRAQLFLAIVLLSIDVYTYYVCNSQNNRIVIKEIVKKIKPNNIAYGFSNNPDMCFFTVNESVWENQTTDEPTTKENSIEEKTIEEQKIEEAEKLKNKDKLNKLIVNYAKVVSDISHTILEKSSKTENLSNLAKAVLESIDVKLMGGEKEKRSFLAIAGFIFGFAALSSKKNKAYDVVKLQEYYELLYSCFNDEIKDNGKKAREENDDGKENWLSIFLPRAITGLNYARWAVLIKNDIPVVKDETAQVACPKDIIADFKVALKEASEELNESKIRKIAIVEQAKTAVQEECASIQDLAQEYDNKTNKYNDLKDAVKRTQDYCESVQKEYDAIKINETRALKKSQIKKLRREKGNKAKELTITKQWVAEAEEELNTYYSQVVKDIIVDDIAKHEYNFLKWLKDCIDNQNWYTSENNDWDWMNSVYDELCVEFQLKISNN